jgi:hypothetical protein
MSEPEGEDLIYRTYYINRQEDSSHRITRNFCTESHCFNLFQRVGVCCSLYFQGKEKGNYMYGAASSVRILERYDEVVWTVLIWHRFGISGGLL